MGAAALAKDPPATTGGQPPAASARRVDNGGFGHDPNFIDPGNYTARSIAKLEGISLKEAKRLLRAQQRSGLLLESLSVQFPDTFLGLRFDRGPGRLRALFTGDDTPQDIVSQAARAAGMSEYVEVAPAAMSRKDEREFGDRLLADLRQTGHQHIDFTIDPENGTVSLGTTEDAALKALVEATGGSLVHKVLFEPDMTFDLTAYAIAGEAWNAPYGDNALCTTGFSVYSSGFAAYGTTTAGHCDINSPAEFNPYMDTLYGDGNGRSLVFRRQWIGPGADGSGLDIQFHTLGLSGDQPGPYYWNGNQSVPVAHSAAVQPSQTLCKWGRTTKWTCGVVGAQTVCDDIYGCGYYTLINTQIPAVSEGGDSGGPVVSGQTAYGWIHGKVNKTISAAPIGSAVFLSIAHVYNNTDLRLTVCVPGTNC